VTTEDGEVATTGPGGCRPADPAGHGVTAPPPTWPTSRRPSRPAIAERVGVSQVHVSRLLATSLAALRAAAPAA
jgi:hypothetical protein